MTDLDALLEQAVAALARPRRATYRLQLGPALRFEDVGALAPYLAALGVSDAYLSPCFKSGPGSSHGYDVTDHSAFNPEVGSETTMSGFSMGRLAIRRVSICSTLPRSTHRRSARNGASRRRAGAAGGRALRELPGGAARAGGAMTAAARGLD